MQHKQALLIQLHLVTVRKLAELVLQRPSYWSLTGECDFGFISAMLVKFCEHCTLRSNMHARLYEMLACFNDVFS